MISYLHRLKLRARQIGRAMNVISISIGLLVYGLGAALHPFVINSRHASIMDILLDNENSRADRFFLIPLYFYRFVSSLGVDLGVFGFICGFLFTIIYFWRKMGFVETILKVAVFFPAALLFLSDAKKELFLMVFLSFFVASVRGGGKFSWAWIAIYAALFRSYFFGLVAGRLIARRIGAVPFLISMPFAFLALLSLPITGDFLGELIQRRDFGFYIHGNTIRSGFQNLEYGIGWSQNIINYANAIVRLNFPIFFSQDMRDLMLQFYVILVAFIVILGIKGREYISCAVFVHILLLASFEPDLGSYFRHLSSLFPLYFLIIEGAASSYSNGKRAQVEIGGRSA